MKRIGSRLWCRVLLGMILLFGSAVDAASQEKNRVPLSLAQAIQTAVKENPKIAAVLSQVNAAEERITQARSGFIPQVYFSESYNHTTNPMWAFGAKLNQEIITQKDFDPVKLNDPDAIDNFGSTLSVSWSLFDSGQTWYGWRQAKLSKKSAGFMLERTRRQVIAQTVVAYVSLLMSRENLSVIQQTLETARAHLKMVRSRFESGFVVKSDLLRAQVHIAELEQQQLQAESQVEIAQVVLNAVMGGAVDGFFEPTSHLEIGGEIQEALDQWIHTALTRRSDFKYLQHQEMVAREEISKSRAAHLPSVNVVGNYEINTEDFNDKGENYTLGAVMRMELFSGYRLSARTREAEAGLSEVKARRRELELGILVETRQAFLQAQTAWKRIQVAQAAVAQAEEAVRIVRNRYSSGLFTIVDLLDAEVALQQSRTNHFKAIHDYKVATAQLALAAGTIDENFR